jgi:hypothetical protein
MGCFKFDASVKTHKDNKDHAPNTATKTFRLMQAIVKGTQCMVYVTLCARVALMVIFQQIFALVNGQDFWDKLDKHLAKIQREADGDTKKIIKCVPHSELFFFHPDSQLFTVFCNLLDGAQEKHVKTDDPIDETAVNEFQQGIDNLITIAAINTVMLVQRGSV